MTSRPTELPRRSALSLAGAAAVAATAKPSGAQENAMSGPPKVNRFKMATLNVPDIDIIASLYDEWLGYATVERGTVAEDLAASWGTPDMAGRPYIHMQPESGADVFIRAVQGDPVPSYKAMTTWGWNAIEIICDDPDALHAKLMKSPFKLLGEPKGLQNYPSIRATQFQGPFEDVLYLTTETGDRDNTLLPRPGAFVGRIFIMVVAGPDIQVLQDWYADTFNMKRGPIRNSPVDLINIAQGLPLGSERPLTTLGLKNHGNLFELDGYGPNTTARPHIQGQLPPGIASTSVTVDSLDGISVPFLTAPVEAYGSRAATVLGPAGELLELIEETA
jgi:hypothetical protein